MPYPIDRAKLCPWPLLLLIGCSGGGGSSDGPSEPFDYSTTRDLSVDIQVTVDGIPAPFARVQISDTLQADVNGEVPEERVKGALYFAGLTGGDGRLVTDLRLPNVVRHVAVVAHVPGTSGLYSEPLLRSAWGQFAPSSRVQVAASALGNIELALTTD